MDRKTLEGNTPKTRMDRLAGRKKGRIKGLTNPQAWYYLVIRPVLDWILNNFS